MKAQKVTDLPRGKHLPFGWTLITNPNRRMTTAMFCRFSDCSWERIDGFRGLPRGATSGLVIRRMTAKELAAARKEKA